MNESIKLVFKAAYVIICIVNALIKESALEGGYDKLLKRMADKKISRSILLAVK